MIKVDEGPLLILVVDDHDDTRRMFRRLVEGWGCTAIEAANGNEAIEATSQCGPSLILLDLNMPSLDGLATAERIRGLREVSGDVRIIAITAFDTFGMKEAALEAGCDDYITKPIVADELARSVRRLFASSFLD